MCLDLCIFYILVQIQLKICFIEFGSSGRPSTWTFNSHLSRTITEGAPSVLYSTWDSCVQSI